MSDYVVIATKVSPLIAERLNKIAKKKGMSVYEIAQMVYDTLVRYMDDRHNLTPQMEQAMSIFEHMAGWKDALNLADPTAQMEVGEATYYMTDALGKKSGVRAVHVDKPWMGQWSQTENIKDIIERTLCLLTPERYMRLRRLVVMENCESILQLIDKLLDFHGADEDVATYRQEFEDANRSEFGRTPADGPFKRKHYKSPDTFADADSHLQFNDLDE